MRMLDAARSEFVDKPEWASRKGHATFHFGLQRRIGSKISSPDCRCPCLITDPYISFLWPLPELTLIGTGSTFVERLLFRRSCPIPMPLTTLTIGVFMVSLVIGWW
jgi:hypothetical protein